MDLSKKAIQKKNVNYRTLKKRQIHCLSNCTPHCVHCDMDKWFLQNILNHYMLIILLNRIYNCLFHLSSNCVVKGGQMLNGTDRALQLKVVWDTSIFWRNDFVWCITFDIVNQACSQSSLVEFWSSRFIKNKIKKVKNYRQCLLLYALTI